MRTRWALQTRLPGSSDMGTILSILLGAAVGVGILLLVAGVLYVLGALVSGIFSDTQEYRRETGALARRRESDAVLQRGLAVKQQLDHEAFRVARAMTDEATRRQTGGGR